MEQHHDPKYHKFHHTFPIDMAAELRNLTPSALTLLFRKYKENYAVIERTFWMIASLTLP